MSAQEAWLPGVPSADMKQAVFHTVDGGRTFSMLSTVPGPNASLHFTDPDHGWALNGIGAAGNVFYQVSQSLDGGHAWTQLQATSPGGQGQQPMADTIHVATGDSVSFGPQQTIWITSGYGISTPYAGLSVSTDGAKNWTELNPPLPASLLQGEPPVTVAAPQFVTATDAYLPLTVGSHLVIFASHDAGDSWALLPPVLPSNQMHPTVQFVSLESGFAVCGSSLCATQDGGLNWTQIPTPFVFEPSANGSFVAQFDFVDEEDGWAILAAPDGTRSLLKTTDGGRTWVKLEFRPGF